MLKSVVFVLFAISIVFLSQQSLQVEKEQARVETDLSLALDHAKNELILVLGDDSTLKSQIKGLKLSYSGCSLESRSLLPDFVINKKTNKVEICNVTLLEDSREFQQRVVYEFFTAFDLCDTATNEVVERMCSERNRDERYQVDRLMASTTQEVDTNYFTLNVDYGDKSTVFMVVKGAQTKLAFKTNYGDQSLVSLEAEDLEYLKSQIKKIERKFAKPKCRRKVIRLFARNESGQRFRSFACIEDANVHTQRLLKLTRTVTSLAKNTL